MMKAPQITSEDLLLKIKSSHAVWHKFSNWMVKSFGSDLHGKWKVIKIKGHKDIKYRSFNDLELSRRLVGHEVMTKVRRYITRYCPEIIEINCDDTTYCGSTILLIPHPSHGITMMFIPQCTKIQNQIFLYERHYKQLTKALRTMKNVYKS